MVSLVGSEREAKRESVIKLEASANQIILRISATIDREENPWQQVSVPDGRNSPDDPTKVAEVKV